LSALGTIRMFSRGGDSRKLGVSRAAAAHDRAAQRVFP
jgi:hypothetical protein